MADIEVWITWITERCKSGSDVDVRGGAQTCLGRGVDVPMDTRRLACSPQVGGSSPSDWVVTIRTEVSLNKVHYIYLNMDANINWNMLYKMIVRLFFTLGLPVASFHTSSCFTARNDYYQILGISKNASQKEIKNAYYQVRHVSLVHIELIILWSLRWCNGEHIMYCRNYYGGRIKISNAQIVISS